MIVKGAIFDLDGVISKTEVVHAAAWKSLFDKFLEHISKSNGVEFKEFDLVDDYLKYVDGRPRLEGIKTFLDSRDIILDRGNEDSKEDFSSMVGLGLIKDNLFREVLAEEGVSLYSSTISLIQKLDCEGIKLFVASSSKNCRRVLSTANIQKIFLSIFDGTDLEKRKLQGKPHPALFLKVIEGHYLLPKDCVVFEDSIAGVVSAKAGGFFTIGIDRANNTQAFKDKHADLVVKDLEELDFSKDKGFFLNKS